VGGWRRLELAQRAVPSVRPGFGPRPIAEAVSVDFDFGWSFAALPPSGRTLSTLAVQ